MLRVEDLCLHTPVQLHVEFVLTNTELPPDVGDVSFQVREGCVNTDGVLS